MTDGFEPRLLAQASALATCVPQPGP